MELDYVMLKIDTERNTNGEAFAKRLRGDRSGGIPWLVITDAEGKELIASDRPTENGTSNIGCPVSEEERAWFLEMLDQTRQHMQDEHRATIEKELAEFAKSARG